MTNYLTKWAKAVPVKDRTDATATKFLFENVVTRFGFPKMFDKRPSYTLCQPVDCGTNRGIPDPT